jgi:AcrR family transcriptional regulator
MNATGIAALAGLSDRRSLEMTTWNTLAAAFELRHRADGSPYYVLADGSPEWMLDAVREAHAGKLSNDWSYRLAAYIAQAAAGYDAPEDYDSEIADSVVPVYTSELIDWMSSHADRRALADEAIENGAQSIDAACRQGCYSEAMAVFWVLARAVEVAGEAEAVSGI